MKPENGKVASLPKKKQKVWIAEMAHFSTILSATYFSPCVTHEQLLIPYTRIVSLAGLCMCIRKSRY